LIVRIIGYIIILITCHLRIASIVILVLSVCTLFNYEQIFWPLLYWRNSKFKITLLNKSNLMLDANQTNCFLSKFKWFLFFNYLFLLFFRFLLHWKIIQRHLLLRLKQIFNIIVF
jgi:hypothetical protein